LEALGGGVEQNCDFFLWLSTQRTNDLTLALGVFCLKWKMVTENKGQPNEHIVLIIDDNLWFEKDTISSPQ
jgi:hypothetical protein